MHNLSISLFLYLLITQILLITSNNDHLTLDSNDIYNKIINDKQVGMIEFYSSMCGGCAEFAPTWERITEKVDSYMITEKINIDNKIGMKIAQELG